MSNRLNDPVERVITSMIDHYNKNTHQENRVDSCCQGECVICNDAKLGLYEHRCRKSMIEC